MIRFPCPNCSEMVEASNQKAGLAVVCSRCRSLVAAPLPAKEQQSAKSAPWLCPLCGTDQKPEWRNQINTYGWYFFVASLLLCIPLCWITLFIRDKGWFCKGCGQKVGN